MVTAARPPDRPARWWLFPDIRFVATGSDVPSFLDGGARVVALGSALADPDQFDRIGALLRP